MRIGTALRVAGIVVVVAGVAVGVSNAGPTVATSSKPTYYLSLGDSYAVGFQPGYHDNSETLHGFSNQVVYLLAKHGHHLTLENFACGGATTTTMLTSVGCLKPAKYGVAHPTTTQFAAVKAFLATHHGHVGLITLSIGANDFYGCVGGSSSCVSDAMTTMTTNLKTMTATLRADVGPTVPIIAITYPDAILGSWVWGANGQAVARQSVPIFKSIFNPALKAGYAPAKVSLVDVTTGMDAFVALSTTTTMAPYGTIPVAVAKECLYTWYCSRSDIHPTSKGYTTIAQMLSARYLKLVK